MVLKFLTDYIPDGEQNATKDLFLIAKNYIKNGFVMDLIPLLPISFIVDGEAGLRIAFTIKLLRIHSGLKLFNVRALTKIFKNH